jgi:hypothetical protein
MSTGDGAMPDQRSLSDQVADLYRYAIQQGMYDAADWLTFKWTRRNLDPASGVEERDGG